MQKDVLYYIVRPVSQVVKTSPSHGEGRGSTPLRVTMKRNTICLPDKWCFLFNEINPLRDL